jgi:hypothetical protein
MNGYLTFISILTTLVASPSISSAGEYIYKGLGDRTGLPTIICPQDTASLYAEPSNVEGVPATYHCGPIPKGIEGSTLRPTGYIFEKEIYDGLQTKKGTDELFQRFSEELKKIKSDLRAELKQELLKELRPTRGKQSTSSQKAAIKSDSGASKK